MEMLQLSILIMASEKEALIAAHAMWQLNRPQQVRV
jgi:hypothetical protein